MSSQVPVSEQEGLLGPVLVTSIPTTVEVMFLDEASLPLVEAWITSVRGEGLISRKNENIGGNWVAKGLYVPAMPPTPGANNVVPAEFGQWIIRGVLDEFYPCSTEVMAERYRKASVVNTEVDTLHLQGTDDVQDWAKTFCEVNPDSGLDEGTMISWFANAMQNALDVQAKKVAK